MTPEEEASDLVREVINLSKQNKNYKPALKKLQALAKKDLQAKKIYCMLLDIRIDLEEK